MIQETIKNKTIRRNKNESSIYKENGHYYEKLGKRGEPICIDDDIPFDVPDDWELCRLENICSLLNPKTGEYIIQYVKR